LSSRFTAYGSRLLDGDDFDVGVDLLSDEALDAEERARERAGATAAGALVADGERLVVEREHFQPAAVRGEIGAHLLVQNLVDAREARVVAHERAERAAEPRRGRRHRCA